MKILKITLLSVIAITGFSFINPSDKIVYSFKKGEILDILLLTNKPDIEPLFDRYKKTAFPVAMGLSYQPLPGFKIGSFTQGNIQPGHMVLGKWGNRKKREQFLSDITHTVPDFHEQRRAIWSQFLLTYYEMSKDITFEIDKTKFQVVTAYWQKDASTFKKFKKQWLKQSKKQGGRTVLELTNGTSPFGYHYQPDYMVISEWENDAAFQKFYAEDMKMKHQGVQHVNQFILN